MMAMQETTRNYDGFAEVATAVSCFAEVEYDDWSRYFGARYYDPNISIWLSVDPLADDPNQVDKSPYAYAWNNPVYYTDPDGRCPWCIGALVGAALDIGIQLTEIALDDKKTLSDFSITSVGVSAAAGAVGVGIATKVDKALKVANMTSKALNAAVRTTTDAATDATTSAVSQKIRTGEINPSEVLIDAVAGGTVGKIAGDAATKAAKNSPSGKVLIKQSDRAERVAGNTPRPSRQASVNSAHVKADNYVASRGAAAGTAAQGVASQTVNKVLGTDEKK